MSEAVMLKGSVMTARWEFAMSIAITLFLHLLSDQDTEEHEGNKKAYDGDFLAVQNCLDSMLHGFLRDPFQNTSPSIRSAQLTVIIL